MGYRLIMTCLCLGSAALAGCAATTPALDAQLGNSVAATKARQTRDPAGALHNADKSVDGIEAKAASNSMDRYYKSFATPPTPMTIINIGTTGGGAAAR